MKLSKKFSKKIKSKAAVLLCAITAICAILATDKVINKQNSIFQYIANSISTTSTSGSETSATSSNIIKSGYNICVSTTGSDETGDGTKEKPYSKYCFAKLIISFFLLVFELYILLHLLYKLLNWRPYHLGRLLMLH